MTLKIFYEWLKWFDGRINRKVLLILDNCSAHGKAESLPPLTNTEVLYLPPNMTSKIQPMDAGIIRSFKARYRLHFSRQLLSNIENGFSAPAKIDILTGIRFTVQAWNEVQDTTIANCFRKCKIRSQSDNDAPACELAEDDVDAQLSALLARMPYENPMQISFLLNYPDEQEVSYMPTDEEIAEDIRQSISEPVEETEDEVVIRPAYNVAQAVKAMEEMMLFWQFQDHDTQVQISMSRKLLEDTVDLQKKRLRQSSVRDYFKPVE